jgi:hypothetical protein
MEHVLPSPNEGHPAIAILLWIVGGLALTWGLYQAVMTVGADSTGVQLGAGAMLSGLLLLALGSAIDFLAKIERHLRRPANGS